MQEVSLKELVGSDQRLQAPVLRKSRQRQVFKNSASKSRKQIKCSKPPVLAKSAISFWQSAQALTEQGVSNFYDDYSKDKNDNKSRYHLKRDF